MESHPLVKAISAIRFENCFNPYIDRCSIHDQQDAPFYRATTLSRMVSRAEECSIDAIWLGRDLGYRGGRRTGLALTDDVNVQRHAKRWGIEARSPTIGTALAERTAAVIWGLLDRIEANIFLWNVFPLHPHDSGNPFSNRQHNAKERRAGEEVLRALVAAIEPARIMAIGNNAASAARRIAGDTPVMCVRHPSYGGQTEFVNQVTRLYHLTDDSRLLLRHKPIGVKEED